MASITRPGATPRPGYPPSTGGTTRAWANPGGWGQIAGVAQPGLPDDPQIVVNGNGGIDHGDDDEGQVAADKAAESKVTLPMNPTKGGMPASAKTPTARVTASKGDRRCRPANSSMATLVPSRETRQMTTKQARTISKYPMM